MPIRLQASFPFVSTRMPAIVPAVRIAGTIGARSPLAQGHGTPELSRALDRAFALPHAPAVALVINSPGGSAVQSHIIHRHIRALAEKHERPVLAFVEDLAASGGYMIACAADEIVADPASVVGSIGVVSAGFGFTGLLERLGVERRLHTAGSRKAMLDPFSPERSEDVAHLSEIQADVHEHFIDLVRERRGARIATEADLFDGRFWSGKRALELGLVDGLGTLRDTVRERFGAETRIRFVEPGRRSFLRRLFFGAGEEAALGVLAAVEDGALRARFRP